MRWYTMKRKKERENQQKDGGSARIETANRRTREERGREREKRKKKMAESCQWAIEGVCRLLTLFPCCSLQRARIMKRARGFRQWEGKKITSKLAAHLNWDNPKTVVLNACCTGSDVPLLSFFFPSPAPFCRFWPEFSSLCGSTVRVTS